MTTLIDKIIKILTMTMYIPIFIFLYIAMTTPSLHTKIGCLGFITFFIILLIHNILIIKTSEIKESIKELQERLKK